MKIGFSIGIAVTSEPGVIAATARKAEELGFHSLWIGEHVVMSQKDLSGYLYTPSGRPPISMAKRDFLDPFVFLAFVAAQTERIRLGIGVTLVPLRHPLLLAKSVASLDKISTGRFDFGIGTGWHREEYVALGVRWDRRGDRMNEYVRAMQAIWIEDVPEFSGEFCSFSKVEAYPKPVQHPHPPLIVGGNSEAALRRTGELGDGWYGFALTPAEANDKIRRINDYARRFGRESVDFRFAVCPGMDLLPDVDEIERYRDAGVNEIILVSIPFEIEGIARHLEMLGEQVVAPAAAI
jgi:probable F420-dependent oxidoreductase